MFKSIRKGYIMSQIRALRGTKDIFGADIKAWHNLEEVIRNLCIDFGFNELRTPVFEFTNLFQRGVGETTDIVQKEMYTFTDKGKNNITLKPEGTAPTVRAYLEHKMYADTQPTKLYYMTPAFRYEKPQAGRQRQFHQFGIELFGAESATADAEVIAIASTLLDRLGIKKVDLHINSLGGPECREKYNEMLSKFLQEHTADLCGLCQERMEKNPLRVLDCKNPTCAEIVKDGPTVLDCLGEECQAHFKELQYLLTQMKIPFIIDSSIVRGLDYYTKTVFEFISNDIGSQGTVCGGGRYDKLVEEVGGTPTPAVGFGAGIERLLLVQEAENGAKEDVPSRDIYIGAIGQAAVLKAHSLVHTLRQNGISAEADHMKRSVRAQMKYANKIGAKFSMIIGDNEIEAGQASLKNMETGDSTDIKLDDIASAFININK